MAKKFKKAEFSLDDFREQMQMMRQMGDMKDLLKMIPGVEQAMKKMGTNGPDPDKEMKRERHSQFDDSTRTSATKDFERLTTATNC